MENIRSCMYGCHMSKCESLRHYIFIDPNNINLDINKSYVLNSIKKEHKKYYLNNEKVIYWSYADIAMLAKKYDSLLYELFMQINVKYAALLADIGRYLILYFYGGVYNDLKFISTSKMNELLKKMKIEGVILIADSNPKNLKIVRNGNIISLCTRSILLDECLQKIKSLLAHAQKNKTKGPREMWVIGSGTYIDLFAEKNSKTIIKLPLVELGYIIYDSEIYLLRTVKWQSTFEYLFK